MDVARMLAANAPRGKACPQKCVFQLTRRHGSKKPHTNAPVLALITSVMCVTHIGLPSGDMFTLKADGHVNVTTQDGSAFTDFHGPPAPAGARLSGTVTFASTATGGRGAVFEYRSAIATA